MSDYQGRNGRNNDIIYWLAAIVFLATGIAAPIGFLMIVLKLLGGNRRRRGRHPYYTSRRGKVLWGPVPSARNPGIRSLCLPVISGPARKTPPQRPKALSANCPPRGKR